MYFKNILKLYLAGMLVDLNNLGVLEVFILSICLQCHLCIFVQNMRVSPPSMELCTFVNFLNRFHNAAVPKLETENESGLEITIRIRIWIGTCVQRVRIRIRIWIWTCMQFFRICNIKNNRELAFFYNFHLDRFYVV